MQGKVSHYNDCNVLSMHGLIGGYRDGEEWVEQMIATIDENIAYACDFIKENFPGVRVMRPQGTYMLYLDCGEYCREKGVSIAEIQEKGVRCGVIWQNGEAFMWPDTIRVNLALPKSRLVEAMDRLEKYVF